MKSITLLFLSLSIGISPIFANDIQNADADTTYQTIDQIVTDIYDIISGEAGVRDWDRFRNLYNEKAVMGIVYTDKNSESKFYHFTPEDYINKSGPVFEEKDFFETELKREEYVQHHIAYVESSYQYSFSKDGPAEKRGINSIQLVYENGRWWVVSLIWQEEGPNVKIGK